MENLWGFVQVAKIFNPLCLQYTWVVTLRVLLSQDWRTRGTAFAEISLPCPRESGKLLPWSLHEKHGCPSWGTSFFLAPWALSRLRYLEGECYDLKEILPPWQALLRSMTVHQWYASARIEFMRSTTFPAREGFRDRQGRNLVLLASHHFWKCKTNNSIAQTIVALGSQSNAYSRDEIIASHMFIWKWATCRKEILGREKEARINSTGCYSISQALRNNTMYNNLARTTVPSDPWSKAYSWDGIIATRTFI